MLEIVEIGVLVQNINVIDEFLKKKIFRDVNEFLPRELTQNLTLGAIF